MTVPNTMLKRNKNDMIIINDLLSLIVLVPHSNENSWFDMIIINDLLSLIVLVPHSNENSWLDIKVSKAKPGRKPRFDGISWVLLKK
jgi:hypothetical protein